MASTIIRRAIGAGAGLALSLGIGLVGAVPAEAATTSVWDKVAQCESGGNWKINTGNGFLRWSAVLCGHLEGVRG